MTELIFDKDEDWGKRMLCVDESCIGTIGPDGRCRECGKPYGAALNPATGAADKNKEQAEPVADLKKNTESTAFDEERALHNCIKPIILSFPRRRESSIINSFLDTGLRRYDD
jgi:hypothetical protein